MQVDEKQESLSWESKQESSSGRERSAVLGDAKGSSKCHRCIHLAQRCLSYLNNVGTEKIRFTEKSGFLISLEKSGDVLATSSLLIPSGQECAGAQNEGPWGLQIGEVSPPYRGEQHHLPPACSRTAFEFEYLY